MTFPRLRSRVRISSSALFFMKGIILKLLDDIDNKLVKNNDDLVDFKNLYNKKFNELLSDFLKLDVGQKKEIGPLLNELRSKIDKKYKSFFSNLNSKIESNNLEADFTIPVSLNIGNNHPLSNLENTIIKIFSKMGFSIVETQEIEDDWHNFSALNVPLNHPAREMQDTFFIADSDRLLRTHTTSSQIRILEKASLPVKCISVGRVYRNETISARSHCYFNQIDAFYVDQGVSILDLIHIFKSLFDELFGRNVKIRIRPSYFPFTSPSIELDVECFLCNCNGCSICKNSGWLEVFGGGVIHENVLKNCNIDSNKYSGIALGGGIERLALLIHRISDIRCFATNDIRFLSQFKFNSL